MMARPSDRGRYKYGVCTNRNKDGEGQKCPKCECGEVQKVRAGDDFVCNECKEPLRQVPEPKQGMNMKLIVGIAVAVIVVAGGIGAWIFTESKSDLKENIPEQTIMDSLANVTDTVTVTQIPPATEDTIMETNEDSILETVENTPPSVDENIQTTDDNNTDGIINLGYAIYDGPKKNGKPHGIGGKLTFKAKHSIDLKKMPAEYLEIQAGEYIENTKFENGRLKQGELHRKDGSRKWIHI